MSKKVTMTISQYNYDRLQKLDGATMEDKVKTLFAIVEPFMPQIAYTEQNKTLKVTSSTKEFVDTFRITIGESRDNILTRAFMVLDEINKSSAEDFWIPFKITNPYNNLLIIEGQLEYNSKELSFNYRGNVFRGKLPPTYIVNGVDLTKEMYLWYDNLDWTELSNIMLQHSADSIKHESSNYILEVNQY